MPEVLSLFNSDETTSFVLFLTREWGTVSDLLSLPDLMSGLGGLRAHMILGPQNTRCFRQCLLAVTEVDSLLPETCPEMNRGDVSALVSAFPELFAAMNSLCSMFLPNSFQIPVTVTEFLAVDFRLASVDPISLTLSSKMTDLLATDLLSLDMELLFRKRFLLFLSSILLPFQKVLTQWYNGGLVFFDLFSLASVRKFDIDEYEARFERLTSFLLSQNLVSGPLIS